MKKYIILATFLGLFFLVFSGCYTQLKMVNRSNDEDYYSYYEEVDTTEVESDTLYESPAIVHNYFIYNSPYYWDSWYDPWYPGWSFSLSFGWGGYYWDPWYSPWYPYPYPVYSYWGYYPGYYWPYYPGYYPPPIYVYPDNYRYGKRSFATRGQIPIRQGNRSALRDQNNDQMVNDNRRIIRRSGATPATKVDRTNSNTRIRSSHNTDTRQIKRSSTTRTTRKTNKAITRQTRHSSKTKVTKSRTTRSHNRPGYRRASSHRATSRSYVPHRSSSSGSRSSYRPAGRSSVRSSGTHNSSRSSSSRSSSSKRRR